MKPWMIALSMGATLLVPFMQATELQINRTASLPHGIFLVVKGMPYQKGDLVSVRGHPTAYFGPMTVTKRVTAVAGESVPMMPYYNWETKEGKPLHPLKDPSIPPGHLFLSAPHRDSFDSRYEEFGLVRETCVIGRAFPLC